MRKPKTKLCDDCGESPATTERTLRNGRSTHKSNICDRCASKTMKALAKAIKDSPAW